MRKACISAGQMCGCGGDKLPGIVRISIIFSSHISHIHFTDSKSLDTYKDNISIEPFVKQVALGNQKV